MLLREPDGNAAQLFNNGNVSLQQQSQQSWTNKTISPNSNTIKEDPQIETETDLSLSCREHQLREALEKSMELDITNGSEFINYRNNLNSNRINVSDSNNLALDFNPSVPISEAIFDYSPDEGLFDYEEDDRSYSSSNTSAQEDDDKIEHSGSDDSYSNDTLSYHIPRGIHNPNYPGFQHLAYALQDYVVESPSSYEHNDISSDQIEYDDGFAERLEEIRKYDEQTDTETILEPNNNNNEIEDSFTVSTKNEYSIKTNENSTYYATDTNKIILQNNKQKSFIEAHSEKVVLNCSDRNDNILSVTLGSGEEARGTDSEKIEEIYKDSIEDTESISIDCGDHFEEDLNNLDYEEDFIELKREIYESIQKPIAATLENISDVVNNVIRYIIEEHDIHSDIWKVPVDNTSLQNLIGESMKILEEEDRIKLSNINAESDLFNNNSNNTSEDSQSTSMDYQSDASIEVIDEIKTHMDDAYMSNVAENLFVPQNKDDLIEKDSNDKTKQQYDCNSNFTSSVSNQVDEIDLSQCSKIVIIKEEEKPKTNKHDTQKTRYESIRKPCATSCESSVNTGSKNGVQRKSGDKKSTHDALGAFDVYNIETAMPLIDLDAIENHLRVAREEERRRRNDREEIRRRLAMGTEQDDYYSLGDRPGRKPSLQARLQSGMNLQICFMNETASDTESPSDFETNNSSQIKKQTSNNTKFKSEKTKIEKSSISTNNIKAENGTGIVRPNSLALNDSSKCTPAIDFANKIDFFECQARLQTEARMALAQAKEIAHMQMEIERQQQEKSPITEMLRSSLEKAGVQFLGDRRRVSRQMLTDINVAQLQVIVNELHTQIEFLNESLVEMLIARDELHMGQDSMLVDIEDLTRHLGARDISCKTMESNEKSMNEKQSPGGKNLQYRISPMPTLILK
ncbi:schwannomin interacting protein 1 [Arctopsyche grandis]|uniref:schwannomin interacting protein 1 n=1 Tax=Arctopsyche grandis TaxID=121162 RepID=UPI00406D7F12